MPTGDYTDKWRTKTFSYSLSSWDQILQQRWVGRFCHQRDSCHELSAVLATLTNCEENIEEKCGLPLTRKITNNLIMRHGNLFPGIGPIATKLRRAARLQLNSYQVWIRALIYLMYLQWRMSFLWAREAYQHVDCLHTIHLQNLTRAPPRIRQKLRAASAWIRSVPSILRS